jgi:hypothetical protein
MWPLKLKAEDCAPPASFSYRGSEMTIGAFLTLSLAAIPAADPPAATPSVGMVSSYSGQLLQRYSLSRCSGLSSFARTGFK